jgi:hypothetical protein
MPGYLPAHQDQVDHQLQSLSHKHLSAHTMVAEHVMNVNLQQMARTLM